MPVSSQARLKMEVDVGESPLSSSEPLWQVAGASRARRRLLAGVERWLHEPLLHFLVAGGLLFGLSRSFDHSAAPGVSQKSSDCGIYGRDSGVICPIPSKWIT